MFLETAKIVSGIVGVGACMGLSSRLLQPILSILSDFWFYQFHILEYPEIVEHFT